MPRRAAAMVKEWANLHRAQLEDNWDICPDVLRLWCEQQPLNDHRGSRHGRPGEECGLGIEGLRRAQLIAWHVHHMRISLECDCSDEEPHARPFLVHRRAVVPGRARGHAGKANRSQSQVFGAVARTDQATTTATVNESPPVAALRLGQVTCAP